MFAGTGFRLKLGNYCWHWIEFKIREILLALDRVQNQGMLAGTGVSLKSWNACWHWIQLKIRE
jgi:hypothetical protein